MKYKKILAIETSCDDTSCALVGWDGTVFGVESLNQDQVHRPFGGIVPEIAGRNHSMKLLPLLSKFMAEGLSSSDLSWKDVDAVCATSRPGLIGSLIVGVVTAKSLAQSLNVPFLGVNHLEGHIWAPFLKDDRYSPPEDFIFPSSLSPSSVFPSTVFPSSLFPLSVFPFLALTVSGGHTSIYYVHDFGKYEVLGSTLDDAAGETLDKFAKRLGLGFPGGQKVDEIASQNGQNDKFHFPRALLTQDNLQMSFSGMKSSAMRLLDDLGEQKIQEELPSLCASFQEAVVDTLIYKLDVAVRKTGVMKLILSGGVSANSRLRTRVLEWAQNCKQDHWPKLQVLIPPLRYCTDNAAMIGYVGILRMNLRNEQSPLNLGPSPYSYPEDFRYEPKP